MPSKSKAKSKAEPKAQAKKLAKAPVRKIIVGDSPIHGQGVFAALDLKAGEVIELCPYLVIDDDDLAEENRLNDYLFTSPDVSTDYLVIMGYGMMYNHSSDPNAEWEIDDDNRFVKFSATKDIAVGEEIFQNYGEDYWNTRK